MKNEEFANGLFAHLNRARADYPEGKIDRNSWLQLVAAFYGESKKPKPKQKSAVLPTNAPKPRNLLFDALAIADGQKLTEKLTKNAGRRIGEALKQIRDAMTDVTPEEINARAAKYRRLHPTWTLTSTALASHWGALGVGDATASSLNDPYVEPSNWRPAALSLFPDALDWGKPHDFRTIGWYDVDMLIRRKVLDRLKSGGSKTL